MSSFLAGALMTTFFAPATMWARAFSASVNRPVDSMTMSTPRSPHGSCRRVLDLEDLHRLAVDDDRVVGVADLARVGAVGRVVLEQERIHLDVDEVVDGDDLDLGGSLDERLEGLAADAAEAVDTDTNGHVETSLGEGRLPTGARRRALDGTEWRTVGRTLGRPAAGAGRCDVGSAATVAGMATAAATSKPGIVPRRTCRSKDR